MDSTQHSTEREETDHGIEFPRRAVLMAAGTSAGLSLGTGSAVAGRGDADNGTPDPDSLDPIFGWPSAGPNPCAGDADASCLEEFPEDVSPSHEVEVHIEIPEPLFALAAQGGLSELTTGSINREASDGDVTARNLHRPDASVEIGLPGGGSESVTVAEIAGMVAETRGFHYDPTGIHVHPGDVVLFSAETPDHGVAAYHERHGRQNRVPDEVGPIAAPLIPAGGYWLVRLTTPGVYDFYCPPHQVFGMVMRIVVHDGSGDVPSLSVEDTGRPPERHNALPMILGGLDPNVPSSGEALDTDALDPENIVDDGPIHWEDVVAEHRGR